MKDYKYPQPDTCERCRNYVGKDCKKYIDYADRVEIWLTNQCNGFEQSIKKCTKCGIEKSIKEFNMDNEKKDGLKSNCKTCRYLQSIQYKNDNSRKVREGNLKVKYKLSSEKYNELLVKQNNVCCICGLPEIVVRSNQIQNLSVDHCHVTGTVRGLLCMACNVGISRFKDNIDILASAISYLQQNYSRQAS